MPSITSLFNLQLYPNPSTRPALKSVSSESPELVNHPALDVLPPYDGSQTPCEYARLYQPALIRFLVDYFLVSSSEWDFDGGKKDNLTRMKVVQTLLPNWMSQAGIWNRGAWDTVFEVDTTTENGLTPNDNVWVCLISEAVEMVEDGVVKKILNWMKNSFPCLKGSYEVFGRRLYASLKPPYTYVEACQELSKPKQTVSMRASDLTLDDRECEMEGEEDDAWMFVPKNKETLSEGASALDM